jgi:Fe2+ or Zn2+ uptake regulation protein
MTHTHQGHKHIVHTADAGAVLRVHGFRVTRVRTALLELLQSVGTPLSVQGILECWLDKIPDTATLYRSLTDLHAAGIVKRIELGTGMAHFEYTPHRPHHHHLVCTTCGMIEELEHCSLAGVEEQVLAESQLFKSIYSHNLEFFGQCTICATIK